MDPFVVIYYAIVCGCLGWVAPNLGKAKTRLAVGALVGVAAAALLPVMRGSLGL